MFLCSQGRGVLTPLPACMCCACVFVCVLRQVLTCVRMVADLLRAEDPAYKMSPKPHVTSRFLVLPEMIGPAIIGKGGTHAKHIKERTGVRIEVIRELRCFLHDDDHWRLLPAVSSDCTTGDHVAAHSRETTMLSRHQHML